MEDLTHTAGLPHLARGLRSRRRGERRIEITNDRTGDKEPKRNKLRPEFPIPTRVRNYSRATPLCARHVVGDLLSMGTTKDVQARTLSLQVHFTIMTSDCLTLRPA